MKFLGHVMRREKIESVVMTGRVDGTRDRGRQREKYMDGILALYEQQGMDGQQDECCKQPKTDTYGSL